MGGQYWSLSKWAKLRVKKAVNFIGAFEKILAAEAAKAGVDGVICGHIHHAELEQRGDILYVNTGDWVESCTAIVEDFDGTLSLVDWSVVMRERNSRTVEAIAAAPAYKKAGAQRSAA